MTLQSAGGTGFGGSIRALGPWFHNLHLPTGEQTAPDHPLGDFPSFKWRQIGAALPADLTGCRALDVGCNAGFYSFELARRGADVMAIDHDPHYLRQAEWASHQFDHLRGTIEFRELGVYDLSQLRETFDLVLFLGVLYHLRYPLLGLDLVAERCRRTLVLQTLTMPGGSADGHSPLDLDIGERERLRGAQWPAMAFVEHRLADDPTNWWVPSAGAVEAMVRTTGLSVTGRPGPEMWICTREHDLPHRAELEWATGRRR
ncbi:MAG: methyltransferase, family [Ilumatobacteraceae bacterium]|nr:methyltransferase, family [Ilumatobacteraceae bacterium]